VRDCDFGLCLIRSVLVVYDPFADVVERSLTKLLYATSSFWMMQCGSGQDDEGSMIKACAIYLLPRFQIM